MNEQSNSFNDFFYTLLDIIVCFGGYCDFLVAIYEYFIRTLKFEAET